MRIRETRAVRGGRLLLLAAALAGGTLCAEIVEYWVSAVPAGLKGGGADP